MIVHAQVERGILFRGVDEQRRGLLAALVAALRVHTTEEYPALDIRVDDHAEPIEELRRLHEKSLERYQPFTACLPSRLRPAGITNRSVIEAEIERFQARRRGAVQ